MLFYNQKRRRIAMEILKVEHLSKTYGTGETRVEALKDEVGGQAVLGRQGSLTTPWLTERHGYDPTSVKDWRMSTLFNCLPPDR